MKTVTLVAINTKGYYAPAPYLLRAYACQDEELKSQYRFSVIDPSIVAGPRRRSYNITFRERLADFLHVARRLRVREVVSWSKTQIKYSAKYMKLSTTLLLWWTLVRVLATRPAIVAFSCYIWNVTHTVRMAQWIKKFRPRTIIVLGGQEVTNSGTEFLRGHPAIDFIVDGEGEETFRLLLRQLLQTGPDDVKNMPGLITRRDDRVEKRPLLEHLEELPSLFSIFRNDPAMLRKVSRSVLGYMVETARGCPFKCSFCFESEKFKSVRHFPLERISDEIIGMSFFGFRKFHILDPVLCNSDHERLGRLAGIIRQANGNGNTDFSVEVYAELLKEDMLDYLDVFSAFDVGLQTRNPSVLERINRYFNEDKFLHGIGLLKAQKKFFSVYLIYGLPGESFFSFIKSMLFVIALKPPEIYINHLCVLRGTPLRRIAEQEKLDYDPTPPYYIKSTGSMSTQEVIAITNLCSSFMKEFKATGGRRHAHV